MRSSVSTACWVLRFVLSILFWLGAHGSSSATRAAQCRVGVQTRHISKGGAQTVIGLHLDFEEPLYLVRCSESKLRVPSNDSLVPLLAANAYVAAELTRFSATLWCDIDGDAHPSQLYMLPRQHSESERLGAFRWWDELNTLAVSSMAGNTLNFAMDVDSAHVAMWLANSKSIRNSLSSCTIHFHHPADLCIVGYHTKSASPIQLSIPMDITHLPDAYGGNPSGVANVQPGELSTVMADLASSQPKNPKPPEPPKPPLAPESLAGQVAKKGMNLVNSLIERLKNYVACLLDHILYKVFGREVPNVCTDEPMSYTTEKAEDTAKFAADIAMIAGQEKAKRAENDAVTTQGLSTLLEVAVRARNQQQVIAAVELGAMLRQKLVRERETMIAGARQRAQLLYSAAECGRLASEEEQRAAQLGTFVKRGYPWYAQHSAAAMEQATRWKRARDEQRKAVKAWERRADRASEYARTLVRHIQKLVSVAQSFPTKSRPAGILVNNSNLTDGSPLALARAISQIRQNMSIVPSDLGLIEESSAVVGMSAEAEQAHRQGAHALRSLILVEVEKHRHGRATERVEADQWLELGVDTFRDLGRAGSRESRGGTETGESVGEDEPPPPVGPLQKAMVQQLSESLTKQMALDLPSRLIERLLARILPFVSAGLQERLPMLIGRSLLRSLASALSASLSFTVPVAVLRLLPMYLTAALEQTLGTALTLGLTHSLSATLTYTLKSSPESRKRCAACTGNPGLSECVQCRKEASRDNGNLAQTEFYASYFGDYFADYYFAGDSRPSP